MLQWMEMHDVGFGECIVLGGARKDILMVDCGSLHGRLQEDWLFSKYVQQISTRYGRAQERTFLLTHFHKDHYCGLPMLLRGNPYYFDRIYLPNCPLDEKGVPLLLELAIITDCFLPKQTQVSKMTAGTLRVFDRIGRLAGTERLYALQAGDCFDFDGVTYEVLWPPRNHYPFPPVCQELSMRINHLLGRQMDQRIQAFLELKEELCQAYVRCMDAFAMETSADEDERVACVEDICLLIRDLDYMIPSLLLHPAAGKIYELLCGRTYGMAYSDAVNGASLIFHNRRRRADAPCYDDILMTGDAVPASMDAVAPYLYESYYVVKAPHHGTESGWWEGMEHLGISHLLISNGTHRVGGKLYAMYPRLNALSHCTNTSGCAFAQENGCCNRDRFCEEAHPRAGSALTCKSCGCGIFITGIQGERWCLCK